MRASKCARPSPLYTPTHPLGIEEPAVGPSHCLPASIIVLGVVVLNVNLKYITALVSLSPQQKLQQRRRRRRRKRRRSIVPYLTRRRRGRET